MNPIVKKLTTITEEELSKMTDWMYEEWGLDEGFNKENIACKLRHSLQEYQYPQTYGLFLENTLIGMYQFTLDDLPARPDIYPWLANVYIAQEYRQKGYSNILLSSVIEYAKKYLPTNKLFLYTKHTHLFEKYGWEFLGLIEPYQPNLGQQRFYRLSWN